MIRTNYLALLYAAMVLAVLLLWWSITLAAVNGQPLVMKYCVRDQQQEDYIHRLMSEAADDAFKERINHLFDIWVKDPSEQPSRAVNGAAIAINAYVRAQRALQDWHPPRC